MTHLTPITDEQREINKQKRLEDQQYARENLKVDYADEGFWREQASNLGLRMPLWWIKASETKYIRRACKKLGLDVKDFIESTGFKNLNEFAKNNPTWTAFGMTGLIIDFYLGQNS